MHKNRVQLPLLGQDVQSDSRNLITLNADVHIPQFDDGAWASVPKHGQYLNHSLRLEPVLAERYRNTLFESGNIALGRFLLARFVWANCKNLERLAFYSSFRPFDGDDGDDGDDGIKGHKDGKTKKRPQPDEDTHRGDKKGPYEPHGTRRRTRATPDRYSIMCHELTLMFTTQMMK